MVDLLKSREEIDKIDREIVGLFQHRMEVAKNVAEYKISTGKKVYDKQREAEKLESLRCLGENEFNKHGIDELFTQIMAMSRKLQYSLLLSEEEDGGFLIEEKLDVDESTKVACFGMKGSHTEQAMNNYFEKRVNASYYSSFKEIMQAVKEGKAEYGILPIENTSTGGIADIYDLLDEYDNYIIGEEILQIKQALLGLKGTKIEDLTRVYSHPQGLLQCAKFLEQFKNIEQLECASTSESAQRVVEENNIHYGAIAGSQAAEFYGLEILKEAVNFNTSNSTRFIIVTNKKMFFENANRISICFELPHESGTLYNMLSNFIYNNLNMTQIESRPIIGKSFEYRFFVDIEGNLKDPGVKNALFGIREEATKFKTLGNFFHK